MQPHPLKIFNGLYIQVNGDYIDYSPAAHYLGCDNFALYIKDSQGDFIESGLNGRETIISYSPRVEIQDMPYKKGVRIEANKTPAELNSIISLLPEIDWHTGEYVKENHFELETKRRE